jgi:hypothetical protein
MVRIQPTPDQLQDTAKRLLDAAESPTDVATDTSGNGVGFVVSEELARKAGFVADDDTAEDAADANSDQSDDSVQAEQADDTDSSTLSEDEATGITEAQNPTPAPTLPEPPRSGAGSSEVKWREFLAQQDGFTVPGEDADRGALIAAWDEFNSPGD